MLNEPVFYEAGDNHDALHWVISAESLKTHSYMVDLAPDTSSLMLVFNQFTGLSAWDGRLGTELYLSLTSYLLGIDALYVYNAFCSSFFIFWLAAIVLIIGNARKHLNYYLLILFVFAQPLFLFFVANNNFPNMVGVILFAFLFYLIQQIYRSKRLIYAVLAGLCANCMCAVYPEMLPFVFVALSVFFISLILKEKKLLAKNNLIFLAVSFVSNPVNIIRAKETILLKMGAVNDAASYPTYMSRVDWHEIIPAIFTFTFPRVTEMAIWLGVLMSISCLYLLYKIFQDDERKPWLFAVLFSFLLLCLYSYLKDFTYGYQKAIQNHSIFLSGLIFRSVSLEHASILLNKVRYKKVLLRLPIFIFSGLLLYASGIAYNRYINKAFDRSIANSRDGINELSKYFENNTIMILDSSFSERFFYSSSLAYIFRNEYVLYPKLENSFRWLEKIRPEHFKPLQRPRYMIVGSKDHGLLKFNSRSIDSYGKLTLLENDFLNVTINGIYNLNSKVSWTSGEFSIEVDEGPGVIEFQLDDQADYFSDANRLIMTDPLGNTNYFNTTKDSSIRLLANRSGSSMWSFKSEEQAMSPFQLKGEADRRNLAFRVSDIKFTPIKFLQGITQIKGLHAWEGEFAWMSDSMEVSPNLTNGDWFNFLLVGYFPELGKGEIEITCGKFKKIYSYTECLSGISLNHNHNKVFIRSVSGARRPSDVSQSKDERPLSFRIKHLSNTDFPLY